MDPIEGGIFRRTQVYVGNHIPPKPQEVHILMNSFLEWMNSKEAGEMHPIKLAAIAHYKLVHIHPFTDGNGRTSRLLMNTILMRFGFPPVVIQKQQRWFADKRAFIDWPSHCNLILGFSTTITYRWRMKATFDLLSASLPRPRRKPSTYTFGRPVSYHIKCHYWHKPRQSKLVHR